MLRRAEAGLAGSTAHPRPEARIQTTPSRSDDRSGPTMMTTSRRPPRTSVARLKVSLDMINLFNDAPIQTTISAMLFSMELSRSKWLITCLSPGSGERMSKQVMTAGDVSGLLERLDAIGSKAEARTGRRDAHLARRWERLQTTPPRNTATIKGGVAGGSPRRRGPPRRLGSARWQGKAFPPLLEKIGPPRFDR